MNLCADADADVLMDPSLGFYVRTLAREFPRLTDASQFPTVTRRLLQLCVASTDVTLAPTIVHTIATGTPPRDDAALWLELEANLPSLMKAIVDAGRFAGAASVFTAAPDDPDALADQLQTRFGSSPSVFSITIAVLQLVRAAEALTTLSGPAKFAFVSAVLTRLATNNPSSAWATYLQLALTLTNEVVDVMKGLTFFTSASGSSGSSSSGFDCKCI